MDPSLDHIYTRLGWSDQHLNRMAEVAGQFMADEDAHEIIEQRNANSVSGILRIRREPPVELGLILGDWLHNLHAALDNLITQLVYLNRRTPGKTSFPIFDKPRSFDSEGMRRLKNVRADHVTMIQKLQPYPGRDDKRARALGIVGTFSNDDKHATVQPALTVIYPDPRHITASLNPPDPDVLLRVKFPMQGKPVYDGAEVIRVEFISRSGVARSLKSNVHVDIGLSMGIAFGKRGLGYKSLPTVRRYIGAVIDLFAAEFPESARPIPLGYASRPSSTWPKVLLL